MSYITKEFDGQVLKRLQDGSIGFMPSDTVYGISARALDQAAAERIYKVKARDADKPFVILISSVEMLDLLSIAREEVKPVQAHWPGPLTIICNAPTSPAWLHRGSSSLAVRLPNQPELLELIEQTGPLVSTSANKQGKETLASVAEAQKVFGESLDFFVDKGRITNARPSTIVRMDEGKLKVVRQGAVKL